MSRLIRNLGVVCLACSVCGCGTLLNTGAVQVIGTKPENRLYGGVRWDAEQASWHLTSEPKGTKSEAENWEEFMNGPKDPGRAFLCLIEMPFSIAADTLTLPLVIVRQISAPEKEAGATKEPEKKVAGRGPNEPAEK